MHKGKAYLDCIPRQQAQELWQQALTNSGYLSRLPSEEIAVQDALGRVTARAIYAAQSVPHYNGAAMDGIAVRSSDTFGASETAPRQLTLLPLGSSLTEGTCTIVDTGDLLPLGADAVIMIEDVHIAADSGEIMAAATPWQHVRIIGEDIVLNELVVTEGQVLEAAHIGALIVSGLDTVPVLTKPKVTIIPTGSELVATRSELKPGLILDVNSHMLAAAIASWGGTAQRHAIVKDDFSELTAAVAASLADSDLVIINAGTSAGTEDFTAKVLAELGEVLVHGVAIKPGKPVVLAMCQGKPVIGLPGYPVSAMLTAELFAKPVLQARQNLPGEQEQAIEATSTRQLFSQIGVEEFIRVSVGQVNGKHVAAPLGRGAGLISSLTKAQGMLAIPAAKDGLAAGTKSTVKLFGQMAAGKNLLAVGSHDLALDILGIHLKRWGNLSLTCANVGSMGGIMAMNSGECHVAGIHLLDAFTGGYNVSYVRKYLKNIPWKLVHLARREQGIIVAQGNPRQITDVRDLVEKNVLFVNRQRGAGTRMLLDYQLHLQRLNGRQIRGYDKEVATHMAVAATVAAGAADAGMGIRAAAVALGLDFIPLGFEQYDIIVNLETDEEITLLRDILKSSAFRYEVEQLGGYDMSGAGKIVARYDSEEVEAYDA